MIRGKCAVASLSAVVALQFMEAERAFAQDSASSKRARIGGQILDSLHMQPLRGARVIAVGTNHQATTNEDGEYIVHDLSPGQYRIEVKHALLDSLGISLESQPIKVEEGSTEIIDLNIPSAPTLVAKLCPATQADYEPGAIMGTVVDNDTGEPAPGATVIVRWKSFVSKVVEGKRKMQFVPLEVRATADERGIYRICGVPPNLSAILQVTRGNVAGGIVRVAMGSDLILLRSVRVASTQAAGGEWVDQDSLGFIRPSAGSAVLSGKVLTKDGQPVRGATVSVLGAGTPVRTAESGEYTLRALPAGTQTIVAQLPGYRKVETIVQLSTTQPREVNITLGSPVPQLAPVNVAAEAMTMGLKTVGFEMRKEKYGQGKYFTHEQINATNSGSVNEFIARFLPPPRKMSPARLMIDKDGNRSSFADRPGNLMCTNWWVDGRRISNHKAIGVSLQDSSWNDLNDLSAVVDIRNVAALEVYNGLEVPAQYTEQSGCRVILIWSLNYVNMQVGSKKK
jgi:hypothetical protein